MQNTIINSLSVIIECFFLLQQHMIHEIPETFSYSYDMIVM